MKTKITKKFLVKNGFRDIGGDEEGNMYEHKSNDMTFWMATNGKNNISFCYSEDGWYQINNPTIEQVKFAVEFFNSTTLLGTKDFKKEKCFSTMVLGVVGNLIKENQKIISK